MEETLRHNTILFVKSALKNAEGGHDWFHTERVWKLSTHIAATLPCDHEVVELGALLHDIADPKFHGGDETVALTLADRFLRSENVAEDKIQQVLFILRYVSFKNRGDQPAELPLELKIVQDADRLDAIGAIGIARTFNFGGFKNNPMYDPDVPPNPYMSKQQYKKNDGTTINHFYEKLLLLKGMMHTEAAKKIARKRHDFMLHFLEEFYREWRVDIE